MPELSSERLADGLGTGGVVRVERLWPGRPDRLHVLLGAGRVMAARNGPGAARKDEGGAWPREPGDARSIHPSRT